MYKNCPKKWGVRPTPLFLRPCIMCGNIITFSYMRMWLIHPGGNTTLWLYYFLTRSWLNVHVHRFHVSQSFGSGYSFGTQLHYPPPPPPGLAPRPSCKQPYIIWLPPSLPPLTRNRSIHVWFVCLSASHWHVHVPGIINWVIQMETDVKSVGTLSRDSTFKWLHRVIQPRR